MLLTIRTLSCPPPDTPQSIHAQFDAAGGRIGRSSPCKLILPDPNRHISREHAEIRSNGDAFSIKVVSKVNSILVNDEVVGPGQAVTLKDGDQVLIGEYLMRADITSSASAQAAAPAFFAPPAAAPSSNPFDMFDNLGLSDPKPAASTADSAPDWFKAPAAPAAPAPAQGAAGSLDDFFDPAAEESKFSDLLKNNSPTAPAQAARPPPADAPVDNRLDQFLGLSSSLDADQGDDDPLRSGSNDLYRASALDRPMNPAARPPSPVAAPATPSFPADDDIFKSLEQDFGPAPTPAPEASPFASLTPAPAESPRVPPSAPPPSAAPAEPAAAPPFADFDFADLSPAEPTEIATPTRTPTAPAAAPDPVAVVVPTPEPSPTPAVQMPAVAAAVAVPIPVAAPAAAPVAAAAPPAAAGSDQQTQQLMATLAESLGLAKGDLDSDNPEETIRLVGELLRMTTDGLFRLLEMRSQLKSELHIEDRTMIASRENNPLKHADTAHDAIAYLVDVRQHGNQLFMPPGKAVEDTIWDICAHEMAVMAGTRAALLAALKMFSPEVIEGRIKKTGALQNVLPAFHKSRLWERFLGMYAELQHEAEDHFDRLLNQEFSKAYSEQSKKLKKKR